MCKKIIDQSNLDINKILKESKKSKGVLPSADFIFLSEEQKEKFFNEGNIHYIKNNNNQIIENKSINNNLQLSNNCNIINININNNFNILENIELNNIDNFLTNSDNKIKIIKNTNSKQKINIK